MYLWIKTLHVVAIISWMAGLLYLPRLFVYHADSEIKSIQSETFKLMEKRLLYAIMTPAMVVAWSSGLFLAFEAGFFRSAWFHWKLLLVIFMTIFHIMLTRYQISFSKDENSHPGKYFRVLNEIPTILMLFIVGLVIVKP